MIKIHDSNHGSSDARNMNMHDNQGLRGCLNICLIVLVDTLTIDEIKSLPLSKKNKVSCCGCTVC